MRTRLPDRLLLQGARRVSVVQHPAHGRDGGASRRSRHSRLPARQWVLAVPKRLRYFLHRDPVLQGTALRLFLRAVEQCLRARSAGAGPATRLGAVAFIHRFGSALNPHLHFHCVVLDGVLASAPAGGVVFHPAAGIAAQAFRRGASQGVPATPGELRAPWSAR